MLFALKLWASTDAILLSSAQKGGSPNMTSTYTGKYTKIDSGYMGQLVEWPEVVTEGATLEECRELLRDALQEMVAAYQQEGREIPLGGALLEQVAVET
jgi:predicted RNase H-like HicB family nuclease